MTAATPPPLDPTKGNGTLPEVPPNEPNNESISEVIIQPPPVEGKSTEPDYCGEPASIDEFDDILEEMTTISKVRGYGASEAEWKHFDLALGLTADMLPVASNSSVPKSPSSAISEASRGKVPSEYRRGKVGGITGWTAKRSNAAEVAAWSKNNDLGICIQTREVRAIDIDIADPAIAQQVVDLVVIGCGTLPKRMRSNSGKCLLAFRMPGKFSKSVIETPQGKIEFLADGQHFVALGTHPSGERYEWEGGLPAQIPTLSDEEFAQLWDCLHGAFAAADEAKAPRSGNGQVDDTDAGLDRDITLGGVTDEVLADVTSAMQAFKEDDADDYDFWVPKMGHALKSLAQAGHEEEALELWHAFSALSPRYDQDEAQAKWDSIEPNSITYKSIFTWASEPGRDWVNPRKLVLETPRERATRIGRDGEHKASTQRVMTGTEMLDELVFIAEGARVSFISEPRAVLPLSEFKHFTAASCDRVKVPNSSKTTKVQRAQLWVESPDRKTVRTQTFAPGREPMCLSPENVQAQNLWVRRSPVVPADWLGLSQPFFDHVSYMVPDVDERERFLDWLAHIEQQPGVLPSTHYLLVARQTGIGRNWLAYALAQVFAGHTALGFDLGETLRSGFNGALSQTLLAVVDELHEGGPGGSNKPQAEKLKSLLTEATRRINPKYGRQHVEFNCCRFLMFSNHEAALPLADNDRRVVVIENPTTRKDADYYKALYKLLEHPDLGAALAEAFRQRDISGFNPGEIAPMNDAKRRTIRAGRSEVEQVVRDIAAEWPSDCITASRLSYEVGRALGSTVSSTQGAGVAAGLVKFGSRVKVAGTPQHIWILRNMRDWATALPREVSAEAIRGEDQMTADDF